MPPLAEDNSAKRKRGMNNLTAIIIAALLVFLGLADWLFNDATVWTFLGRRLIQLTEYLAVWR